MLVKFEMEFESLHISRAKKFNNNDSFFNFQAIMQCVFITHISPSYALDDLCFFLFFVFYWRQFNRKAFLEMTLEKSVIHVAIW